MISQTSEYALRAAIFLADRGYGNSANAQEISSATQVPVGYLQKVLRSLSKHNILSVHRGTGGGFALAKVPTAISVLDILKATSAPVPRIERCPLGIGGHRGLCALHRLLDTEMARSEITFASTTLADLVRDEGGLGPLCSAAGAHPLSATIDGQRASRGPGVETD